MNGRNWGESRHLFQCSIPSAFVDRRRAIAALSQIRSTVQNTATFTLRGVNFGNFWGVSLHHASCD
jgi:hypothetical protein